MKLIVTISDVRAAHLCSRGARNFFLRHGLDWKDFLKNGIEAGDLEATGDAMALPAIEMARKRRGVKDGRG